MNVTSIPIHENNNLCIRKTNKPCMTHFFDTRRVYTHYLKKWCAQGLCLGLKHLRLLPENLANVQLALFLLLLHEALWWCHLPH